jgi:hypothetical protein
VTHIFSKLGLQASGNDRRVAAARIFLLQADAAPRPPSSGATRG